MPFLPVKSDTGAATPWEYYPAAAGDYQVGQLLNISDGKLTAITAPSLKTPPYVSMRQGTAADGEVFPVIRVSPGHIYETTLGADAASAAVGGRLQVNAGGLDAVSGAGSFELVAVDGVTQGSTVRGRWTAPVENPAGGAGA